MDHDAFVRRIADAVRARPPGRRLTIQKAHPGHTPHDLGYKDGCHPVAVDGLDRILSVDGESATVEGQVTLGQLCRATLAQGLMPKVVPEFETFTVAGLVNGLGIETSSHRHGVFPASVTALEVVLGNGDVVDAGEELLGWLPGSYGTLGVVTRATLSLERALPFVRTRYQHFRKLRDYVAAFGEALGRHQFVEGFVFARDSFVLCCGDYAASGGEPFSAMKAGNPWYYQHALASVGGEDLIPSYEYVFRHQRSLLWLSGIIADLKIFSNTRWGRAWLDREVERKVRTTGFRGHMPIEVAERCVVSQDMGMRLSRLEEGIEWVEEHLGVHPLWNCPTGGGARALPFATPRKMAERPEMVVDIGIYGEPTVRDYRCFDAMRALQRFVDVPSLWGISYLTREELREIYDFEGYEAVQRKYHAQDAFVPLESKVRFMKPGARQGRIPLWRLVNLYYDLRAVILGIN